MRRVAFALTLMLVAVSARADKKTRSAEVEASNQFFADKTVPKFVISPDEATLNKIRQDPRTYIKVPVTVDGVEYKDVGIHLKGGAGSYRGVDDKPALTLNFDKFVEQQRFHGLDKIHLNNSVQDPTWMTELICGDLFRASRVPAARTTHAVVELAGKPRGLYVLKEGFNRTFLRRYFKDTSGTLYDGGFLTDITQPLQQTGGSDKKGDRSDLKALAEACREGDLAKRMERIAAVLDVDRFISFAAMEVMTWHWDGYTMKTNNYRIYHDPSANKITFIAHGMDQMFWEPDGPITAPSGGLVARSMFEIPEWRKKYYARVAELRQTVFLPDALEKRIDELAAKLMPVLKEVDKNTARDFENRAKQLKDQVRRRAESIDRQLAARKAAGK
jgi:spore coat protein CotH